MRALRLAARQDLATPVPAGEPHASSVEPTPTPPVAPPSGPPPGPLPAVPEEIIEEVPRSTTPAPPIVAVGRHDTGPARVGDFVVIHAQSRSVPGRAYNGRRGVIAELCDFAGTDARRGPRRRPQAQLAG